MSNFAVMIPFVGTCWVTYGFNCNWQKYIIISHQYKEITAAFLMLILGESITQVLSITILSENTFQSIWGTLGQLLPAINVFPDHQHARWRTNFWNTAKQQEVKVSKINTQKQLLDLETTHIRGAVPAFFKGSWLVAGMFPKCWNLRTETYWKPFR